jgi:hypothetical protein
MQLLLACKMCNWWVNWFDIELVMKVVRILSVQPTDRKVQTFIWYDRI